MSNKGNALNYRVPGPFGWCRYYWPFNEDRALKIYSVKPSVRQQSRFNDNAVSLSPNLKPAMSSVHAPIAQLKYEFRCHLSVRNKEHICDQAKRRYIDLVF